MEESQAKKIGDVFRKIGKTVQVQAEIASLRLQIRKKEGQKREIYQKIGEKVYSLYPKGLVKNSALISMCEELKKLDEEIKEIEEKIASLLEEPKEEKHEEEETSEGGIEEEIEE
jgi:cell division protein FtsL